MAGPAPAAGSGPAWTRADYFALSGITGLVVLIVGLFIGFSYSASSTVSTSGVPAPTRTSFTVASGKSSFPFVCGANAGVTVGSSQVHIAAIDGDRITLTAPGLASAPASGTAVTQNVLGPSTVDYCGTVASSPAPTTTQFTITGGAGVDFGQGPITVGGHQDSVASAPPSPGYRITLSSPLAAAAAPGTSVTQQAYTPGSLIVGVAGLAIGEFGILAVAVAAWVARPVAARLRRKPRPKVLETFVFGALIAVIGTIVIILMEVVLGLPNGPGAEAAQYVLATLSGFVVVPLIYPAVSRMFRRQPRRVAPGPAGR
jgi:hypothetical protein